MICEIKYLNYADDTRTARLLLFKDGTRKSVYYNKIWSKFTCYNYPLQEFILNQSYIDEWDGEDSSLPL